MKIPPVFGSEEFMINGDPRERFMHRFSHRLAGEESEGIIRLTTGMDLPHLQENHNSQQHFPTCIRI